MLIELATQQTAYVKNRFIREIGKIISDITEISSCFNIEAFLDSLDYTFLISILAKLGYGKKFITWIEILLKDQMLCVINSGTTIHYFTYKEVFTKVIQSQYPFSY